MRPIVSRYPIPPQQEAASAKSWIRFVLSPKNHWFVETKAGDFVAVPIAPFAASTDFAEFSVHW